MKMTLSLSIMAFAVTMFTGCTAEKDGSTKGWFSLSEKTAEGKITQTEGEVVTKEFDIKDFTDHSIVPAITPDAFITLILKQKE